MSSRLPQAPSPRSPGCRVGIDHGDELQIGPLDQTRVHLPLRLRAAADLGEQDHVARRDEPRPPSTRRGTMVSAEAAPRPPRNVRRSIGPLLDPPSTFARIARQNRRSNASAAPAADEYCPKS